MAKQEAVSAKGGSIHSCTPIDRILAHEAMGHPCEADLVLGGAVTGDLKGQRVASDLRRWSISLPAIKALSCWCRCTDDEGTPCLPM